MQVIQHGACLGLGVAGLGTCDEEAFEDVKNVLYMDNAGGFFSVYRATNYDASVVSIGHL